MNTDTNPIKRLPTESDRAFMQRRLLEVHGIKTTGDETLADLFHLSPSHQCFGRCPQEKS